MSGQQTFDGAASPTDHEAEAKRRASLEEDLTPGTIAGLVIEAAFEHVLAERFAGQGSITALDLCAGFGVWAQRLRAECVRRGVGARITGVEIEARKLEHLRKWVDVAHISDAHDALRSLRDHGPILDLVVSNPPFTMLVPKDHKGTIVECVELCLPPQALRIASAVLVFHTTTSLQRPRIGEECMRAYRPALEIKIPGAVKFRGPGKNPANGNAWTAAKDCYQATLWLRDRPGKRRDARGLTQTVLLRHLTAAERSWRTPPGSESREMSAALGLTMAPGWTS